MANPYAERKPEEWPAMELLKNAAIAEADGLEYTAAAFRAFANLLMEREENK